MNPIKIVLTLFLISTSAIVALKAQNIWKDSEELGELLQHQDTLRPFIKFTKKTLDIYHEGKKEKISEEDISYTFKKSGHYTCIVKGSGKVTIISRKDSLVYEGIHKLELDYKINYLYLRSITKYDFRLATDSLIYRRKGQLHKYALKALNLPFWIDSVGVFLKPTRDSIFLPYSTLVLTQTNDVVTVQLLGKAKVQMNQQLFKLIKPYLVSSITQKIDDQKLKAFTSNPYFSDIKDLFEDRAVLETIMQAIAENRTTPDITPAAVPSFDKMGETPAEEFKQSTQKIYASAPSIGAIDQTAFLKGLAAFIEKRAQEELNILFLNQLKKKLDQSDLGTLFPNSKDQFNRFELSSYKNSLEQALPALKKDMSEIGLNFSELILSKNELKGNAAVYSTAFLIGLIQQSINGKDLDLLLHYTRDYHLKRIDQLRQLREDKQLEKLSSYPTTSIALLLSKVRTLLNLLDGLILDMDTNLKKTNPQSLLIDRIIDMNNLFIIQLEFWNFKRGNTIGMLNHLKKELEATHAKLSYLEWMYLKKFDRTNIEYTIERFDTLFGSKRPSPTSLAKELLHLIKSTSDGKFLSDYKQIQEASEQIVKNLAATKQEMQARMPDSTQYVLDVYKEYWLLKHGLALEKERWLQEDASSNQAVVGYLSEAIEHDDIVSLIEASIHPDFFEKTRPFHSSDKVFLNVQELEKKNAQFKEGIKLYWPQWKQPENSVIYPLAKDYLETFESLKQKYLEKRELIRNNEVSVNIGNFSTEHIRPLLNKIKDGLSGQKAKLKVNPFFEQLFNPVNAVQPGSSAGATLSLYQQNKQAAYKLSHELADSIKLPDFEEDDFNFAVANHFVSIAQIGIDLLYAFTTNKIETILVPQQKVKSNKLVRYESTTGANQMNTVQQDSVTVTEQKIEHNRRWMNKEEFLKLMSDQYQRAMFMGLLYHQVQVNANTILDKKFAPEVLANQFIHFVFMLDQLQITREQKQNLNIQLNFKDYLPVTQIGVKLIKSILDIPSKNSTLGKEWKLEDIVKVMDEAVSLYDNLDKKQYFYALGNIIALYDQFLSERSSKIKKGEKNESLEKLRYGLMKYGNFIAQTASAKDKDEVKNLLAEYALPSGSSQIKRLQDQNISINAYLGPSIARNDSAGLLSLSTPVGLAYSFRVGAENHGYRTNFSIFASLLDLGSIVSYDFSNNKVGNLDSLRINDFFAPGIFLSYNINRSPFTIAAGYQGYPITIGPDKSVLRGRCNLSFLIDVPIFNLFSSKKLKNKPN